MKKSIIHKADALQAKAPDIVQLNPDGSNENLIDGNLFRSIGNVGKHLAYKLGKLGKEKRTPIKLVNK